MKSSNQNPNSNPFNKRVSRKQKFAVLNRRRGSIQGNSSFKNNQEIRPDSHEPPRNKFNSFNDKRIGENDSQYSDEGRSRARFQHVVMAKSKQNFGMGERRNSLKSDDFKLTHGGKPIEDSSDFVDNTYRKRNKRGKDNSLDEIIHKSKEKKRERQAVKEESLDQLGEIDKDFSMLKDVLVMRNKSMIVQTESNSYDNFALQLLSEPKSAASVRAVPRDEPKRKNKRLEVEDNNYDDEDEEEKLDRKRHATVSVDDIRASMKEQEEEEDDDDDDAEEEEEEEEEEDRPINALLFDDDYLTSIDDIIHSKSSTDDELTAIAKMIMLDLIAIGNIQACLCDGKEPVSETPLSTCLCDYFPSYDHLLSLSTCDVTESEAIELRDALIGRLIHLAGSRSKCVRKAWSVWIARLLRAAHDDVDVCPGDVLMMKLSSLIFAGNSKRHVIMTPLSILQGEILMKTKLAFDSDNKMMMMTMYKLSCSLVIAAMMIENSIETKSYVPEGVLCCVELMMLTVFAFFESFLSLAAGNVNDVIIANMKSEDASKLLVEMFSSLRCNQSSSSSSSSFSGPLVGSLSCQKLPFKYHPHFAWTAKDCSDQSVSLLSSVFRLLNLEVEDLLKGSSFLPEVFRYITHHLAALSLERHNTLRDMRNDLVARIGREVEDVTRNRRVMILHDKNGDTPKRKEITLLEPKYDDDDDDENRKYKKHSLHDPQSKQRLEISQLRRDIAKEKRSAIREIRSDANLNSIQALVRDKKVHQAYRVETRRVNSMMEQEAAEYHKFIKKSPGLLKGGGSAAGKRIISIRKRQKID